MTEADPDASTRMVLDLTPQESDALRREGLRTGLGPEETLLHLVRRVLCLGGESSDGFADLADVWSLEEFEALERVTEVFEAELDP